jgi:cytochrome oxidase assembly protein ShyY1
MGSCPFDGVGTPLIGEDGSTVLVDRGFISKEISIFSLHISGRRARWES